MLAALPLVFALIGLTLYVVLAGADFGAGIWQLLAGGGPDAEGIREHAHDSMAPVWEANHVWLIFVITVFWTAYPVAFGSIASTLAIPLFIAAVGIILRGAAYALRSGASGRRELARIDTVFALSSILTPFALGAAAGAIASRRVPVGNAAGHLFTSWLNLTSITIGAVAVTTGGYLAAVYLAADAANRGDSDLEQRFRTRALVAGVVAGAIALAAIGVLEIDCHPLYRELVRLPALAAVIVSIVAGAATLALVWRRRFEAARYCAALATAAVVAGWALAQWPVILPGLTVNRAAAPHDTLVTVVVAVLAGAVILFPSLGLLFRLLLKGRFHGATDDERPPARRRPVAAPRLLARVAIACLIAGFGFLNVANAGWAHGLGVAFLFGFVVTGFLAVVPDALATS